jgi:hypothetical protein
MMKFLLTSAGIKNPSIHNALVNLLGKPIAESSALCIPTAIYPFSSGPSMAYRFISGKTASPMTELGWKSLGVLELTALPSIKAEVWSAAVQAADALLVFGGDVFYLCRWMRESGLADLLPSLTKTVYVGVSCFRMWIKKTTRKVPWPRWKEWPPKYRCRPTQLTIKPPLKWSTARLMWSRKAIGKSSHANSVAWQVRIQPEIRLG